MKEVNAITKEVDTITKEVATVTKKVDAITKEVATITKEVASGSRNQLLRLPWQGDQRHFGGTKGMLLYF